MKKFSILWFLCIMAICTSTMVSCDTNEDNEPLQYSVIVTVDGNGTATADPEEAQQGVAVTLTANPAEGYLFSKWTVVSGSVFFNVDTANPVIFTMPAENVEIKAEFAVDSESVEYSITVTGDGNGEVTASAETALAGTLITLTALPAEGYEIDNWSVLKGAVELNAADSDEVNFLMPAEDVKIKAEFIKSILASIPDPLFRRYCQSFDTDGDGRISQSEAEAVTHIDLSNPLLNPDGSQFEGEKVESLSGLELFPNLEYLNCSNNSISVLDVSIHTKLTTLYCGRNNISVLDVSNNPELIILTCENNSLSVLDVSMNPSLQQLDCAANGLSSLDIGNNSELSLLMCMDNNISNLDVSNNTKLVELNFGSNDISSIDLANNTQLIRLGCRLNGLSVLDITNNPYLESLDCSGNNLSTLNVNNHTNLQQLRCFDNNISVLNVSNLTELLILYCYENDLTSLDVSKNIKLAFFNCSYNNLSTLTFSEEMEELDDVICNDNNLSIEALRSIFQSLPMGSVSSNDDIPFIYHNLIFIGFNPGNDYLTEEDLNYAKYEKLWAVIQGRSPDR